MKTKEVTGQAFHHVPMGTRLVLSWKQFDARRDVPAPGRGGMNAPRALRLIGREGDDYVVEVMGKNIIGFKAGEAYRVVV